MSSTTYEPIYTLDGLERLAVIDQNAWDEVDRLIQSHLAALDDAVRNAVPGVRIRPGCNQSGAWSLYSYRVYASPQATNPDPVVVGVACATRDNCELVSLHGDICGETLGDILFEIPGQEVMGMLATKEIAQDISKRLSEQSDIVTAALKNPGRQE